MHKVIVLHKQSRPLDLRRVVMSIRLAISEVGFGKVTKVGNFSENPEEQSELQVI